MKHPTRDKNILSPYFFLLFSRALAPLHLAQHLPHDTRLRDIALTGSGFLSAPLVATVVGTSGTAAIDACAAGRTTSGVQLASSTVTVLSDTLASVTVVGATPGTYTICVQV